MLTTTHINSQRLAAGILIFAIVLLVGSAGYQWYVTQKTTFLSGAPPAELMQHIPPKSVPYNQIKTPAIQPSDLFILGSPTSSYGIIYYGDYTDPDSNKLITDLETKLKSMKADIRLVYHYLPASTENGSASFESVVFLECARLIDPASDPHHLLVQYAKQPITQSALKKIADQSGYRAVIDMCGNDAEYRAEIRHAVEVARGDGIDTAPFLFVGTRAIPAKDAALDTIIHELEQILP